MLFLNKNKKIVKSVIDYYEGNAVSIPYSYYDIEKALAYCKKYRADYSDETIEKMKMAKMIVS